MPSIKKRKDGRYAAYIYIGFVDGRRKYKTVYGTTQREVKEKAAQLKLQQGRGIDISATYELFEKWCDLVIEDKRAANVSKQQLKNLNSYKNHLQPLWSTPLTKISAAHLQTIINQLATWRGNKKPLAKATIRKVNAFAHQVFDKAKGARVTDYNPAEYVTVAQGEPSKKRTPIEEQQKQWIADTPHRAQTAAMLMLYAGLRRGEVLALTWADIDLDSSIISVNKAVEFDDNTPVIKGTKTEAGTRNVSIPNVLVSYLRGVKSNHLYVVHDNGKMFTASKWKSLWNSYLVELDVKYGYDGKVSKFSPTRHGYRIKTFTPHQLRHTYATMLYLAGCDVLEAKYQLGHSDVKVTLGIYTHFDEQYKRASLNKLNEYLCKSHTSQQSENNA